MPPRRRGATARWPGEQFLPRSKFPPTDELFWSGIVQLRGCALLRGLSRVRGWARWAAQCYEHRPAPVRFSNKFFKRAPYLLALTRSSNPRLPLIFSSEGLENETWEKLNSQKKMATASNRNSIRRAELKTRNSAAKFFEMFVLHFAPVRISRKPA